MSATGLKEKFEMVIIGAGPSGCFMAREYAKAGMSCLMLEAGKRYQRHTYPDKEVDANRELYWSGGIEFNHHADIGFLRPKAVGGGSIVNQALLDRFDEEAFASWREKSKVDFFRKDVFDRFYDRVLDSVSVQEIPKERRNRNAEIFKKGFEENGYRWAPLIRAQKDCRYQDGNDCIECLGGCRIDSKQSAALTALPEALKMGLKLKSQFTVEKIIEKSGYFYVEGFNRFGQPQTFKTERITMAAGSIGNTKILAGSPLGPRIKNLGKNFFTHPQSMSLGLYEEPINSHKGPFQALKSDDASFRKQGFKLENVFGGPVAISMLLPGFGQEHLKLMKDITRMACVEVAIRDQSPGEIKVNSRGKVKIVKTLGEKDLETKRKGVEAIHNIFRSTGAKRIIDGKFNIGLHLMGGLGLGIDPESSVVSPDFNLHANKRIFCADSSVFPNAPGINPSLTIMAMSLMAAQKVIGSRP